MRIIYIGAVNFSRALLEHLINTGANIVGVCTLTGSTLNADFYDLMLICTKHGIPCRYIKDVNEPDTLSWIKESEPDVIFCFGWSFLLKKEVLSVAPLGVLGYHPAALPSNRGRHPLIWALALGLQETASTFFFMDEGADSGDIISQHVIPIDDSDDAGSLYSKMTTTALRQIEEIVSAMMKGQHRRVQQTSTNANYWRKRSSIDGRIDWRMSARSIHNLVRALTSPYPGAEFNWEGQTIKVWKTTVVDGTPKNLEPGKVLSVDYGQTLIKCGEGAIKLLEISGRFYPHEGAYL